MLGLLDIKKRIMRLAKLVLCSVHDSARYIHVNALLTCSFAFQALNHSDKQGALDYHLSHFPFDMTGDHPL